MRALIALAFFSFACGTPTTQAPADAATIASGPTVDAATPNDAVAAGADASKACGFDTCESYTECCSRVCTASGTCECTGPMRLCRSGADCCTGTCTPATGVPVGFTGYCTGAAVGDSVQWSRRVYDLQLPRRQVRVQHEWPALLHDGGLLQRRDLRDRRALRVSTEGRADV